ncbi:hypothetical protein QVD17_04039 [Tagetes erecta]|uniref:non-specific serine/threonine protein kinase n=1 Tax=Tagetes erecta TaxID=13708 RepID=A0AAD8LEQ6_TARER|nr:hypothetical protein QVD17_04039 [Tagetes erecta]
MVNCFIVQGISVTVSVIFNPFRCVFITFISKLDKKMAEQEEETKKSVIFAVDNNRIVFSDSSVPISAQELRSLDKDEEHDDEDSSPKVTSRSVSPEAPSYKPRDMDAESESVSSTHPHQWHGFFRKFKRGPTSTLHGFHPTLHSIKRLTKRSTRKIIETIPTLPDDLDAELHCFEASWTNFSLADLKSATNNFSPENLIGEGGYSKVYKGHLEDGQMIAVKRLIRGTPEEMTSDFLSELGILVHVNHPNIAHIIGYGIEDGMHLVLPLSQYGSLASLLSGKKEKLEWGARYNIAIGTASGLSYLHEACQRRIIHRDIKAANILLSEDFEPKISDFGLAKWLPDQWLNLTVNQFEGTFGYLAPEIFMNGFIDEKTDVYAYGVLLLEIITGRPALDESRKSLVMWAKPLITSKNFEELLDPQLSGSCDLEQLNCIVSVASLCINHIPTERPKMGQVYRMLKGDEGIPDCNKKFQKSISFRKGESVELYDPELLQDDGNKKFQKSISFRKGTSVELYDPDLLQDDLDSLQDDVNDQNQIALEL